MIQRRKTPRPKALWYQIKHGEKPQEKKPRTRIRSVSPKQKRKLGLYHSIRLQFLHGKQCEVFPSKKATEVHHMRGRAGTLLIDTRFFLAVSRDGHDLIHRNPNWARLNGFMCDLGKFDVAPNDSETDKLRERMKDEIRR